MKKGSELEKTPPPSPENPYEIEPQAGLALDEVLNQYLRWDDWNYTNSRHAAGESCDRSLHVSNLCCADHMSLSAEHHVFFRYLRHLTQDRPPFLDTSFSPESLRTFIIGHSINVNDDLAARFCGMDLEEWLTFKTQVTFPRR